MLTDNRGNTSGQNCHTKVRRKETKIQEFKCRDSANVEYEMCGYTCSNWSHQNSDGRFREKFVSHTRKIFNRFTTKDSCTWNITHNTESTTVIKLRRLRWAGHVACMGRVEVHTEFKHGNLMEGGHSADPDLDGRIILKWIFEKLGGGHGLDQSGSG
jgi:hypothetical protein